jgi:hypothetical protein
MVISKSLHIKGRSTRKLASKLTFRGLQSSKDTVRSFEPIHAKGLFYAKSLKIRLQVTSVFQEVTEVNSLKT